jgi:KDO2-lipid IV(A) lauroyltransferase
MRKKPTSIKHFIEYLVFRAMSYICSALPFPWLYQLAKIFYLIVYFVARYRRSVVRTNLLNAFPEKTDAERLEIEKKYYRHLCNLSLETMKGMNLPAKLLTSHWKITNPELAKQYYQEQRSIVAISGHYSNWEWQVAGAAQVSHQVITLYKPLKNPWIDRFIQTTRNRNNVLLISPKQLLRTMIKNKNKLCIYNFIADQKTAADGIHMMQFLNQETECMLGPEKTAKLLNAPALYLSTKIIKPGYYEMTFILITENPKETAEGEITEKFMCLLEIDIKNAPEYWMWGHRRWKNLYGRVKGTKKYNI